MAQDHVRHLMRHDPRDLRFIIGARYGSGVEKHGSAGERKGVDIGVENHREVKGPIARLALGCQPVADALYVLLEELVLDHGNLLVDFGGCLLAELNVLLGGEKIQAGGSEWLTRLAP